MPDKTEPGSMNLFMLGIQTSDANRWSDRLLNIDRDMADLESEVSDNQVGDDTVELLLRIRTARHNLVACMSECNVLRYKHILDTSEAKAATRILNRRSQPIEVIDPEAGN